MTPLADGKYALNKDSWPLKEFPRFVNGGGYLVSRSAVAHLLAAAQSTPVLPVEDVYVTGLCASGARVELIHNKRYCTTSSPHMPTH